jgi:site-specific recombinase XerD
MRRKPKKIPRVLTLEEEARLLAALPSGNTPLRLRTLIMVRLMLNAGLRSQEVCDLRVKNLALDTGKLTVTGKGQRMRVLWLAEDDLALLRQHLGDRQIGLMFLTGPGKKVQTRHLRFVLEAAAQRAGLDQVSPHILRHCFATDLLRQERNLPLVQRALGHSKIATTEIYLHIVDSELETAMKNLRKEVA